MSMEHIERCAKEDPNISGEALTWYISWVQLCMLCAIKSGMFGIFLSASATDFSENDLKNNNGGGALGPKRDGGEWIASPEERVEHETEPRTSQAAAGKAEAEIVGAGNEIVGHGSKHVPDQMLQKYSGGRVLSRTQSWSAELARFL